MLPFWYENNENNDEGSSHDVFKWNNFCILVTELFTPRISVRKLLLNKGLQLYRKLLHRKCFLNNVSILNSFEQLPVWLASLSPAGNCMFKVNNRNTRISHWRRSGVFTVNFKYILYRVLVFLLWTLSR